jgi:hypothetical protein
MSACGDATVDALFGEEIDWDLIAAHAGDMIQVVLSIQAGWVMPSMLLRKLGTLQPQKPALSRLPRTWSGRAHAVPAALYLQCRSPSRHPRRNHQDRGLQRFSRLGLLRRPGGKER